MKKMKKKKGFTLIELVIVLAVLAIIALIAIPNFTKVREDSQEKADNQSLEAIEKVIEMAIIEEKIPDDTSGTIKLIIPEKTQIEADHITIDDSLKVSDTAKADLAGALKEVKTPQQKERVAYEIEVATGSVVEKKTVKTGSTRK